MISPYYISLDEHIQTITENMENTSKQLLKLWRTQSKTKKIYVYKSVVQFLQKNNIDKFSMRKLPTALQLMIYLFSKNLYNYSAAMFIFDADHEDVDHLYTIMGIYMYELAIYKKQDEEKKSHTCPVRISSTSIFSKSLEYLSVGVLRKNKYASYLSGEIFCEIYQKIIISKNE